VHLEVSLRGKSTHAARPDTGHDGLEAATAVLQALYAHRAELAAIRSATTGIEHPTLVVGLIEGGINTNVVPDLVTLRLDRRVTPEEDAATARKRVEEVVGRAIAGLPGIEFREVLIASPMRQLPGAERLVAALQAAALVTIQTEITAKVCRSIPMPAYTAKLVCQP
jgi:succinyl-diaminopimelate desuccinylase